MSIVDNDWEVLYHYTSFDTFVNIIKNREFWLSDITKSNDPLEGQYILQELERSYIKLYNEEQINQNQYFLAHRSFLRLTEELFSHERLINFCGSASFCIPTHELSMLRCYGDNGKGVALGVPVTALENLTKNPKIKFGKIRYVSSKDIENECAQFWRCAIEPYKSKINDDILEPPEDLVSALKEYYKEGYFIKNDVNKDEKEFRLLFYDEELFKLWIPGFVEPVDDSINFFAKDSELKAYYKLPVNITRADGFYIQDVLLGPLCKATTNDVQAFLRRYGFYDCNIQRQSWVKMRY